MKYHYTGNGGMLATVSAWKNFVTAMVGGIGILIGPRTFKSLYRIERIQPRMMVATFNGNPRATIISCYTPTNVSEESELIAFYDELSSLVHSIPKQRSRHWRRNECPNREKRILQIPSTQLVKQEWTTSNRFHDRK